MVRFKIGEVEVFFPYEYVYPEQYDYMRLLKSTLDAKGHCILEMPTGTGKTVALMSLITSYQLYHSEVGKLIYCTRTIPEMEKALKELQTVVKYQQKMLQTDIDAAASVSTDDNMKDVLDGKEQPVHSRLSKIRKILGVGMTSRRNLCIHPEISQEADRDKVDELCQDLTASWIRRKRLMKANEQRSSASGNRAEPSRAPDIEDVVNPNASPPCDSCANSVPAPGYPLESNVRVCQYYENLETLWTPSLLPAGVYTINDMKRFGASWKHPSNPAEPAPFCPYFASRRLLQIADVIVLNYQYILDPKVSQVAFMGGISPTGVLGPSGPKPSASATVKDPSIVVFDEAHNIDNVCIEAFSINMNMMTLERARQNVLKLEKELQKTKAVNADRLIQEYDRLVHNLRDSGQLDDIAVETLANPILPQDIVQEAIPGSIRRAEFFLVTMKRLLLFLTNYIRVFTVKTEGPLTVLKRIKDDTLIDPKILKFCYERLKSLLNTLEVSSLDEFTPLTLIANFFTLLGTYWEGFIIITDPYPEVEGMYDPLIQLSCLDSSLAMRPVIQKFQSVILTSGTISPLFLYPKLLGFEPVITQSLPMSLDRDCICPLIVAKGSDQVRDCFDRQHGKSPIYRFILTGVGSEVTEPTDRVCDSE